MSSGQTTNTQAVTTDAGAVCKSVLDQIKLIISDRDAKSSYWQVVVVVAITFILALFLGSYIFEFNYNFQSSDVTKWFWINLLFGATILLTNLIPYFVMKKKSEQDPLKNMRTAMVTTMALSGFFVLAMLVSLYWWDWSPRAVSGIGML
jgi:formate-dependent nitrite reductase membrane component NrfD